MIGQIDFAAHRFHPVLFLPEEFVVLDLAKPWAPAPTPWAVGRYDEDRAIYTQDLFAGRRTLHVGIDLGGPAGTPVHAFADGRILHLGVNAADGDYGPTIVTEHVLDGVPLYALHGHLSRASLDRWRPGDAFARGDVLGELGAESENGGWPPHVHFQLAWQKPSTHDLPGAVDPAEREQALAAYPDPRLVLGPLYP
jgi:murein DD-endopeptidase MepM/ murein hydrolase activator NlpD